jgi:hypothetical protein
MSVCLEKKLKLKKKQQQWPCDGCYHNNGNIVKFLKK